FPVNLGFPAGYRQEVRISKKMPMNDSPGQIQFGLLPEPEGRSAPFLVSTALNGVILIVCVITGMMTKHIIQQKFEQTQVVFPNNPPPQPKVTPPDPVKLPPPPKIQQVKMEAPRIEQPRPEPKPKAVEMEAKVAVPVMKMAKPAVIM